MSNKTRVLNKDKKVGRKRYLKGLVAGFLGAAAFLKLTDIPKVNAAPIEGSGSAGEIAYFTGSATIASSSHLKWDNSKRNFIGGHEDNEVTTNVWGATISGGGSGSGNVNKVTDNYGTVSGGFKNQAGDAAGDVTDRPYATIGGGYSNEAKGHSSVVGGGNGNKAHGAQSTVGGGWSNTASGEKSTVGGGDSNTTSGEYSTVGGGDNNTASGYEATVGGGYGNEANNQNSTIGGGFNNTANGYASTVGGGYNNNAFDLYSIVGGGLSNTTSGDYSTVSGGWNSTASGQFSTVPGGNQNSAAGNYSVAAGRRAKVATADNGTFLFADSNNFDFDSADSNEFAVRCTGGARFVTAIGGAGNPTKQVTFGSDWLLSVGGKSKFGGWVIPTMDNKYKLGYGKKRWKAVHAVDFLTTSLSQFKENIEDPDDIDFIESVPKPIYFNWKDSDDKEKRLGFMGDYLPDIAKDHDGGIYTSSVTAILCGAVKQMKEENKQLKEDYGSMIQQLKEENETAIRRLEERIKKLEGT